MAAIGGRHGVGVDATLNFPEDSSIALQIDMQDDGHLSLRAGDKETLRIRCPIHIASFVPAFHDDVLRRRPVHPKNMDVIFSRTVDGDARAVRRESGFVTDFRERGKFRELGSNPVYRIEGVKRDLFAVGASLADDTQSCRGVRVL